MPSQMTNYQCPACTGPLHFVGSTGKLQCDYCGSKFTVQEIEALYKDKDEAAAAAAAEAQAKEEQRREEDNQWQDPQSNWARDQGLKVYNCPSCGAELICDETTAATSCPYCNNPSIVPGQLSDMLKPDYVIPFKLDKEAAKTALKNYYRGKKLLPRAFSEKNHIEEIKGVYVPFWLFDGTAEADMSYQGTRVSSVTQGDTIITTTDYYRVHRAGTVDFERIPVDASSKMPDAHMDAIEPFDYSELKPFSNAYLPGFMADKYDVQPETCYQRADERAEATAGDLMDRTVSGYSTCVPERRQIRIRRGKVSYALLPVWLLSTRWNGKNYLFLEMGTIVNPPDYTGLPDGQRPVINGALLCSGNRFFQCLENKSVTPDKELNLLVDTYNAKYLVPTVGDPQEGSITIPGLERSDGVKVVPFFTDIHEYRKYDMEGKHKIAVVSYEQIKSLCFDGQTVVINPMGFNYTLTKETCEAVEKAHSAVGDANDQDRAVIYAPDDIPMTLINELCTVLDNVDGVLKAYIKGLRKSGEKELLIALDCGDASRERAVEIATEAEKKSDSVKSERKLRFIPAASDVGKIASKDTPPFFERIIIDATIDPDAEADE